MLNMHACADKSHSNLELESIMLNQRNQRDRDRRAAETDEQREDRLRYKRERERERAARAAETEEQREERLRKRRERERERQSKEETIQRARTSGGKDRDRAAMCLHY